MNEEVKKLRLFLKKRVVSERSWIPRSDWQRTCSRRNVKMQIRPYETFIGLAYNKEGQLVQITKNSLASAFIFYVTLLEEQNIHSNILNQQSSLSVQQVFLETKNDAIVSEFELLELHVREEGIGERGLLLEALIDDLQIHYNDFSISGSYDHISYSGLISLECFSRYGFKLENGQLIYKKL